MAKSRYRPTRLGNFCQPIDPLTRHQQNPRNLEKVANDSRQAMDQSLGDGKIIAEERVSKGADQAAEASGLDAAQRIEYMYKDRMADVISEWNAAFFGPRGIEILLNMSPGLSQNSILPDEALFP